MMYYIIRGSEVVGIADGGFIPPDSSWLMVPMGDEVFNDLSELEYVTGKVQLKPKSVYFTGVFVAPPTPPVESVLDKAFPETELFKNAKKASETDLAVMSEFAVALYADIIKNQELFNASVVNLMKLLENHGD